VHRDRSGTAQRVDEEAHLLSVDAAFARQLSPVDGARRHRSHRATKLELVEFFGKFHPMEQSESVHA